MRKGLLAVWWPKYIVVLNLIIPGRLVNLTKSKVSLNFTTNTQMRDRTIKRSLFSVPLTSSVLEDWKTGRILVHVRLRGRIPTVFKKVWGVFILKSQYVALVRRDSHQCFVNTPFFLSDPNLHRVVLFFRQSLFLFLPSSLPLPPIRITRVWRYLLTGSDLLNFLSPN